MVRPLKAKAMINTRTLEVNAKDKKLVFEDPRGQEPGLGFCQKKPVSARHEA
jgi:hypothetical protein